ncbi:hypothetical protein VNO77_45178 [Canavalia gladiata]|uniref:Uncharacterized protein n=1 Tax=Canavalia gladiata TaxID=3824 RepID=A0AAN9PLT4_CANGL
MSGNETQNIKKLCVYVSHLLLQIGYKVGEQRKEGKEQVQGTVEEGEETKVGGGLIVLSIALFLQMVVRERR